MRDVPRRLPRLALRDQPSPVVDETVKKTVVNMRLDTKLLRRIDAAAKRQLSVAAARMLDE
jgi:hypothetical protein